MRDSDAANTLASLAARVLQLTWALERIQAELPEGRTRDVAEQAHLRLTKVKADLDHESQVLTQYARVEDSPVLDFTLLPEDDAPRHGGDPETADCRCGGVHAYADPVMSGEFDFEPAHHAPSEFVEKQREQRKLRRERDRTIPRLARDLERERRRKYGWKGSK